ncbi:MAG: CGNR zinc finger domain-containing protein, partial [Trebonia sp.]
MAVALVNLLTPGEDRSRPYEPPAGDGRAAALNALFKSAGSRSDVTSAEAEAFVPVAADLRGIFCSVAAGDIDGASHQVNGLLAATGAHPALE